MGDPHRTDRYGEVWNQTRIDLYAEVATLIKPFVVFSGGYAWHLMSPPDHIEYKHAHDHKDLDIMVPKNNVPVTISILNGLEFKRVKTIYDDKPNPQDFRRYEKTVEVDGTYHKLTIDFFVADVKVREVRGWKVVEPSQLLTFYSSIHSSKSCFAVQAAQNLLARGIDPVGRIELLKATTKI